ncbi:MAG: 3'(2'),5'-bisphosphate nucleotidase CysQ [Burkholderiaceae bacterium]|nr:3'(2'),5'-bisphosphate nucleotidase CysQ [Burkholderiaceae bacterium]MCD8564866.1 3'(2'),5'-bisphosphate nucleotidase CysQ [Burkholderiaceae bacterium]
MAPDSKPDSTSDSQPDSHTTLTAQQRMAIFQWLLPIARGAGEAIMNVYRQALEHPEGRSSALVQHKADQSPLTEADLAAHQTIAVGLASHTPEMVLISEESFQPEQMQDLAQSDQPFWLVDPLDGTKEFLSGTGEFTVNIALIHNRQSVLGVVYQPMTDELFWGGAGLGAWRQVGHDKTQTVAVAPRGQPPWRVLASRSHMGPQTKALIERMGQTELLQAGSSLKFCRIAMGLADFYPRLGYTSQWDTAAAQAVLEGAGGHVIDLHGEPLRYGQTDIINPHFLASALPFAEVNRWWC